MKDYTLTISPTECVTRVDRIPAGSCLAQMDSGDYHVLPESVLHQDAPPLTPVLRKRVLYEFEKNCEQAVSVQKDEIVTVATSATNPPGYTTVETAAGTQGIVPSNYLAPL